ncbi:MAG: hypothetical protein CXZ00_15650 [Acidobacteria bacterium]|nr:MAG: hypothetical protein CXZ00_15650 [Acidobacteriota bacterium]
MEELITTDINNEAALIPTETEEKLTAEITELWAVHTDAQSVVKKTQQELKAIRQNLGERLYAMKQILAKPGCQGGWSSFLEQHQISRTTADRLVATHAMSLTGTTGLIKPLSDEKIDQFVEAVWKRLEKKLGTKQAVYAFLVRIIAESGLANFKFTRGEQHGLAVVDPDGESAHQAAAAAAPANAE